MKHPHAEVIKAWVDGKQIEFRTDDRDKWTSLAGPEQSNVCPEFRKDFQYRIKPKSKVKKWRWAVGYCDGSKVMLVTGEHFATAEEFNSKHKGLVAVQKIDSTMIEVDSD